VDSGTGLFARPKATSNAMGKRYEMPNILISNSAEMNIKQRKKVRVSFKTQKKNAKKIESSEMMKEI
jgi:hypothetical protein